MLNQYIKKIKSTDFSVNLKSAEEHFSIRLHPLSNESQLTAEIVEKMTIWRNRSRNFFKSQFTATRERTQSWLIEAVINATDRVLFLLYVNDQLVGHYGFCNINSDSVELDNAIRGVLAKPYDLFTHVERELIRIAFDELRVSTIFARLFSSNFLAMRLHLEFGFQVQKVHSLKKISSADIILYEEENEISLDDVSTTQAPTYTTLALKKT